MMHGQKNIKLTNRFEDFFTSRFCSLLLIIGGNVSGEGVHGWLKNTDKPNQILYWPTKKKRLIYT